ncbi:MAG: UDP-N-acetylmuramate--L-alanine ligase [Candidatus Caldatribacteriaceae bacterium]
MVEQLSKRFEKLPLRLYFIGIGGTGMSGLALLAQEAGYWVSGSDLVENEATARLRARGIQVFTGHNRERVKEAEAVVVSSAIPEHNEELREARRLNLLVVPRGEMLAFLMNRRKGIAIAGTHGKTTTTSMVSLLLEVAGLEPTVLIGGELEDIGGNAKCGKSEFFVAEADESDGSFLRLSPFCAVVTNIEDDHLEFYGDIVREKEAFATFLSNIQKGGFGVVCGDHENVVDVLQEHSLPQMYTYGIRNSEVDFWGQIVHEGKGNFIFEVFQTGTRVGDFCLNIPGVHNVENALACIAVGVNLGIRIEDIQKTLASFRGVKRRFEKVGIFQGALVIDDYAHHPTEMSVVLDAALHFASGKIMVVFQPHRYTRTGRLYGEMAKVLLKAHRVVLLPIYPANEEPIPGISTMLVYQEMRRMGFENVTLVESLEEAVVECQRFLRRNDIIITMGAGDVWKVGARLCGRDGKE